jgi:hypothetical protein
MLTDAQKRAVELLEGGNIAINCGGVWEVCKDLDEYWSCKRRTHYFIKWQTMKALLVRGITETFERGFCARLVKEI